MLALKRNFEQVLLLLVLPEHMQRAISAYADIVPVWVQIIIGSFRQLHDARKLRF